MGKGRLTARDVIAIFGLAGTGEETARMKRHELHLALEVVKQAVLKAVWAMCDEP